MGNTIRILGRIGLVLLAAYSLCAGALAADETFAPSDFYALVPARGGTAQIRAVEKEVGMWLFLPAFADVERMQLYAGDQQVRWEEAQSLSEDVRCIRAQEDTLYVMQSENLRALFLFSDDPVHEGREYIEGYGKHTTFTTAGMALVSPDGTVDSSGAITKLRGRGNGTWSQPKRPYQFKLESGMDLLKTGDVSEKNRTWVLLAEAMDGTFLRNRITLDLALEMGLSETSRSEFVDLYYDGEYRGLYLLAEKTEIGQGRVEELDYEKLIETWNQQIGIRDLESLPVNEDVNRYGGSYTFVEGMAEGEQPDQGAYLVEIENPGATLSDRCYFELSDGHTYAVKNPENASRSMMRYISERLEEALQTLKNGGVHPQTGRTIEEDFDVDAFVRTMLIHELAANPDGYMYSSSFFVLPDGEMQFRPGPVWDFDLAWRYTSNLKNAEGIGLKDPQSWLTDFYGCDVFFSRMKHILQEEMMPLIDGVLLGQDKGKFLRPLDSYREEIRASANMNAQLWQTAKNRNLIYGKDHEEELRLLRQFIAERSQWLYDCVMRSEENAVELWACFAYAGDPEATAQLSVFPWSHASVSGYELEQVSEAQEDAYAVWQLRAILQPDDGYAFEDPAVYVNGTQAHGEMLEDGSIAVNILFEDPSYLPVDYYGEDVGLVYNYHQYILNHPEVREICGDDPELTLEYFCDEGMYEDHKGNAFFRPSEILAYNAKLDEVLGEDWQMYYWDFIAYGCDDGWLAKNPKYYFPPVMAEEK